GSCWGGAGGGVGGGAVRTAGGSGSRLTVTGNIVAGAFTPPFAVPPLSVTVTVMVANPLASGGSVNRSVPVVPPVYSTIGFGIRIELPDETVTVSAWPDSFAWPAEMPVRGITCSPESSSVTGGPLRSIVGASFTGVTVTSNSDSTNKPAVSVARTRSALVPNSLGFGVKWRFVPVVDTDANRPALELATTV